MASATAAKSLPWGDGAPPRIVRLWSDRARVKQRARFQKLKTRQFEEARKAVAAGVPDGPFEGVPFLLKDLHLGWPGVRLTNGSKLFADFVPDV